MTIARANEAWIEALRGEPEGASLAELRDFLRRGLGKYLGAKASDADLDAWLGMTRDLLCALA